jgi:hypothetical protein
VSRKIRLVEKNLRFEFLDPIYIYLYLNFFPAWIFENNA